MEQLTLTPLLEILSSTDIKLVSSFLLTPPVACTQLLLLAPLPQLQALDDPPTGLPLALFPCDHFTNAPLVRPFSSLTYSPCRLGLPCRVDIVLHL